ncbi:hypothetical protein ABT112_21730 [Streptomyces sp. NPDC002055]|uniref:D-alanine--D-alanine ligase family protein n=1 Tax=Streptomyces sp. NPDC002055 TaxID=3154534 RepID=UPI00331A5BCA
MNVELLSPADFPAPVAVISGGWSKERDRALLSGHAVMDSLARQGVKTRWIDLKNRETLLSDLAGIGLAVLAIAGRGAEDGRLQGLLETLGIDYTGSGVLASAAGMHKVIAKTIVRAAGVQAPASTVIEPTRGAAFEADRIERLLGLPVIIKPISEGGSIGLHTAHTAHDLLQAIRAAPPGHVMAERFHPGRPVSIGILQAPSGAPHVLPALEAELPDAPDEVYSYEAKRGQTTCRYHCPANLSADLEQALHRQALTAHQALGCHAYSRHDFIVADHGEVLWLEVNTLPGLSETGNLARMAAARELGYDQLIAHVVRSARTDRKVQP